MLGSRRERHFRHKASRELACSRETYLHALAKYQIAEGFRTALAEHRPYELILPTRRICRRWEPELGIACQRQDGSRRVDLTKFFDTVAVEARMHGYVADVLLSSSRSSAVLLIEVAVTHACEPQKIGSGLRIIEVSVAGDDQIGSLGRELDAREAWVVLHNFKEQAALEAPCRGRCGVEVSAFHVFASGKSLLHAAPADRVAAIKRRSSTVYTRVLDEAAHGGVVPYLASDGYRREAMLALKAGVQIKCCSICRYAGFRTFEKPVFCRVKRIEVGVNEAAACAVFRRA